MVVKAELYLPVTKRSSLLYRSVSDLENFLKNGFIEKEIKWKLFSVFCDQDKTVGSKNK